MLQRGLVEGQFVSQFKRQESVRVPTLRRHLVQHVRKEQVEVQLIDRVPRVLSVVADSKDDEADPNLRVGFFVAAKTCSRIVRMSSLSSCVSAWSQFIGKIA